MSFRIRVVRPDDLLVAEFEFRGMSLDEAGILHRDSGEALLVVHFPAQSLVEKVLTAGEAAFLGGIDNPSRVPGFLSGESRLAFRFPADVTDLPLHLDKLLDWTRLATVVALEMPPRDTATALEVPWRVVLTALPGAEWKHDLAPHVSGGRTALWMTELRNAASQLRVAWSPDLDAPLRQQDFRTPLDAASRADLVRLSDQALGAPHLALSAMGANFGTETSFAPIASAALRSWKHLLTLGRDHNVSTETEGTLFPFGHRALLAMKVERSFRGFAVLLDQATLTLLEAERTYDTRDFPFVRVRVAVPVGVPAQLAPDPADSTQFLLPVTAVDRGGAEHALTVPVRFLRLNDLEGAVAATAAYGQRDIATGGQAVHYIEPSGAGAAGRYPTESFRMAGVMNGGGFRPLLQEALVRVEALDELTGAFRAPVHLRYELDYLNNGFPPGDPVRQFAKLTEPPELKLSAGQLGGVASLQAKLNALSLDRGLSVPVGVTPAELLESFGGKLLGFLDLKERADLSSRRNKLPEVKMIGGAGERRAEFAWTLALHGPEAPPGERTAEPALEMKGTLPLESAATEARVEGTLMDFPITFLDIATLHFHKLTFVALRGKAPTVEHVNVSLKFRGDLEFLAKLAEEMAKAFPGMPSGVTVMVGEKGVEVMVVRALPTIALGQFTLLNVAFNAAIRLNFTEPATLVFGLSSQKNPFLVSYSGFGGGGFFAMELDVNGPKKLEASIELGAVAEVNFAIVKASAHLLIGFYLSLEAGGSKFAGYVRVHGAVELLGLITVAVDLVLMLTYSNGIATGRAEVTIFVQVLAFSKSVTLSVERSFDMRSLPVGDTIASGNVLLDKRGTSFAERVSEEQWVEYCKAFA